MTMRKLLNLLASRLTKLEGKKKAMVIGNMREALALLKKECRKDDKFLSDLIDYLAG
jgi:hypothetical protein